MEYLINVAILISIYIVLALTLNVVVGYTGLLSVTHAAFYGIGAYVTALLMVNGGANFFVAAGAGMLAAGGAALLVGVVLSKFRGDYYALGSIGFNIIIFSVLLNWDSLTRGPLGIPGIARPQIFGFSLSANWAYLLLCIVVAAIIFFITRWIAASSFGRVLKAIREDETAVQVFGYRASAYKLVVFVVSAALAGAAGALFASYITFIDPTAFTITESIFVLAVIILGGLASLRGSVVGAVLLVLLPEFFRFVGFPDDIAAQMRQVLYGLLLVVLMIYRPEGLIGEYKL